MTNNLKSEIDARLQDMDWHGEAEVIDRIHDSRQIRHSFRKSPVLVICVLLIMLCGTAFAMSLHFSEKNAVVQLAKAALSGKYQLTYEMIDIFDEDIERDGRTWIIRYTSTVLNPTAMGEYEVIVNRNNVESVSWSYDGHGQLINGDLSSAIWGRSQLERILMLRYTHAEAFSNEMLNNYSTLSLEQRAEIDLPLMEYMDDLTFINIAPEGHDLQPNDAEKLARNAIMQKYGWPEESILDMDASISFHLMSKDQSRIYTYWFYTENNGSFRVVLESPSGRVRECKWVVDPAYRTLPASDLSDYVEAAKEFIEDGCFELLSPAEKGSVAQRYYSAGLELLLPDGTYVIPEAKDISEGDAVKIAQNALIEQYGFCKEDFSLFTVRSALTFDKADRVWIISYNPRELDYRLWRYDAKDRIGVYTVMIDACAGTILECKWTHDGYEHVEDYDEYSFGKSPIYTADMLGWIRRLTEELLPVLAKYPDDTNFDDMSLEDMAACDARMRQAGFDEKMYRTVLPDAEDITQDEAISLAQSILSMQYTIDEEALRNFYVRVQCYVDYDLYDTPIKVWKIIMSNATDMYRIVLRTEDGLIESISHDFAGLGEG